MDQKNWTPYRPPSIAERKKWLFSSEERLDRSHPEDSISQSCSLTTLHHSSTGSRISKAIRFFRRSTKMNRKPPVPVKSDRIKNLPLPCLRTTAPPLKPLPYTTHREAVRKPEPPPRKNNRQHGNHNHPSNHQPTRREILTSDGGSPPFDEYLSPQGEISQPSPLRTQVEVLASRPRLDTPVVPPDVAPLNGTLTPPVPLARTGAAATLTTPGEINSNKSPPTPRVGPKPFVTNSKDSASTGDGSTAQDTEGYNDVVLGTLDDMDEDMYSTVLDGPRKIVTPSQTPPTPLSRSLTPPVPLPRPPLPPPASTSSEYDVTSHIAKKAEIINKPSHLPPNPTPPDTYSALARPDRPNKSLDPVPLEDDSRQAYSLLDRDGIQHPAPPVKPANQDEGYSHLEFDVVVGSDVVPEHNEMNSVLWGGGEGDTHQTTNPDDMGIYEVVSPPEEVEVGHLRVEQRTHRPLSQTRSAPSEPKSRKNIRKKPKIVARHASQKSAESLQSSRDGVAFSRYHDNIEEKDNEITGREVGGAKLAPPTPAPKPCKRAELESSNNRRSDGQIVSEQQVETLEEDEFYCIPPDATGSPASSLSSTQEELDMCVETAPLECAPLRLHTSNYDETRDSVTGEEQVTTGISDYRLRGAKSDVVSGEAMLNQPHSVEDGRASSSSLVRAVFTELQSRSPTHVMINIDEMTGKGGGGGDRGEEGKEKGSSCRHSYETVEQISDLAVIGDNWVEQSVEMAEVAFDQDEDLSQYELETVRHPDPGPDTQGYCEVEVNQTESPSLLDKVLDHLERSGSDAFTERPPRPPCDDDITNYDLQTVAHPPVTMNAQGYSYCALDIHSPSESTPRQSSGGATGILPPGYSEIDVLRKEDVTEDSQQRQQNGSQGPKTAPKPQRRKGGKSTNDAASSVAVPLEPAPDPQPRHSPVEDSTIDANSSDADSLYARVLDIKDSKKEAGTKAVDSPPSRPSPKTKRKKRPSNDEKGALGVKGRPRRRPPPPPPPGAIIAGNAPPDGSPTPQSAPPFKKDSPPTEREHRFEQTLPPLPAKPPPSSPSRQRARAKDDLPESLTSCLPASSHQAVSPKLPQRKEPLRSPSHAEPPSPVQRRGLFSRKGGSLKTRKSDHGSPPTPHSPLLTEETGKRGEQSPKLGWKRKFFRRGSNNTVSSAGNESTEASSQGNGESRKRRSREDKLPEVPNAEKSKSLPSPTRHVGASGGVHIYDGEEEDEVEDDLYSVVNKPEKPQPEASVEAGADAHSDGDDVKAASRAYEVVPPLLRVRTGSRGRNDVIKKSNSVEHLHLDNDPHVLIAEERAAEVGSQSACSSPVLPRRGANWDGGGGPPDMDLHNFHLGTLPRKCLAPTPQPRHVYATVTKNSPDGKDSKAAPPSPLPKPKRDRGRKSANKDPSPNDEGTTCTSASFDMPRLEVVEPPPEETQPTSSSARTIDENHLGSPEPAAGSNDKPRDEDALSLQGLLSYEISHEVHGGEIYALVNKKCKKKQRKKEVENIEAPQESVGTAAESSAGTVDDSIASVKPKKKPPAKPPRIKPPKPAPYFARPGSPIPAILAVERVASPVTPPSPSPPSLGPSPQIPDCAPMQSPNVDDSNADSGAGPATLALPPPHTGKDRAKKVSLDVEQQRARLSVVGPPSFPPPPPPEEVSPPPQEDHMYETPPALVKSSLAPDPTQEHHHAREDVKAPPTCTAGENLKDDFIPGYDVVSNPKSGGGKPAKPPPLKQTSAAENSNPQSLPPPVDMYKDERAKLTCSAIIPRSPHLYEAVPDEMFGADENARPASIAIPRRVHLYESPSEVHKKMRRDPPPKKRPPPPPPTAVTKPDHNIPNVATEQVDSPNEVVRPKPNNALVSPVTEIVSNPTAYLGTDLAGKKLTVDIQYDVEEEEEEEEGEAREPRFLFHKQHCSNFIHVGQEAVEPSSILSPCHSSTTQSSSTISYLDYDSDPDIMYSTEWESSSGEEDEEDEEEEGEEGEGRVIQHKPARSKTFYIAQEILTTERTYVKGLRLIDKDFRSAILSANRAHDRPVISDDTLKLILGNVSSILTLNSGMLSELEERIKIWDVDPRIGDIILNRAPYMKIYSEFISRFDKALKTLEETTKKNPQFARVLREFEAQPACAHLPLAGYMLETVQRIPRYKLLLTDYVKHLPENSPDVTPSEKALDIISSVATHVNETIRQMDNFRKVMEVRKKLIGDTGDTLITPYRKLIREGMLLKFSRKEPQPRMFFLFNDILIYASSIPPTNTTFKVIKRIPLEGMKVQSLNDPDMRHGFQIISTCKSFRLEASSNEELHQWMSAFDTAIKEHREKMQTRRQQLTPDGCEESERIPLGHLAPPWLPDSAVSMCQLCSVQFTVTRRRHHCRACGQIFCSDCSSYLAPLRYKSDKLGRVCQSCYESINGDADERTPRRGLARSGKSQKINLPSVLREMKARDQNAQISGYLLSHATKSRRWKKKWFIVYNLVLYEFEKHEDVTAKSSVALPSYQIDTTRQHDPLVFSLKHPGTGKLYFKADTEEQRDRWLEVLEKAVKGEISSQQQDQQPPHTPFRAPSPPPDNNDTSS